MKQCFICKDIKEFVEFSPSNYHKDGFKGRCKSCINQVERIKRANGCKLDSIRSANYRKKHPETRKESLKKYQESDKGKSTLKVWRENDVLKDPDKWYLRRDLDSKKYNSRLKRATLWGMSPHGLLNPLREKAKLLSIKTGIKHSIDHIMPLGGRNSSGLNVPWNIQIIPLVENLKKGNKESNTER